ncbi:MAG: hypothetical protein ACPG5T_08215, partial [Endozoicomonas sp.]
MNQYAHYPQSLYTVRLITITHQLYRLNSPPSLLKVAKGRERRKDKAKNGEKMRFTNSKIVNEHFEPFLNAVLASA